jgi:uncharacterized RmlC-like cupin family protein
MTSVSTPDWRLHGVRVVRSDELDLNTPQTPGMTRAAAITHATAGANKLWAGTVTIHPNAKTGPHHHGKLESVIYVISGRARMRWGERLEFVAEAGPGDFIYVPPFVPHQEINASHDEPLACVVVRNDQEPIVVNLDIPPAESPEEVHWVDHIHPHP